MPNKVWFFLKYEPCLSIYSVQHQACLTLKLAVVNQPQEYTIKWNIYDIYLFLCVYAYVLNNAVFYLQRKLQFSFI